MGGWVMRNKIYFFSIFIFIFLFSDSFVLGQDDSVKQPIKVSVTVAEVLDGHTIELSEEDKETLKVIEAPSLCVRYIGIATPKVYKYDNQTDTLILDPMPGALMCRNFNKELVKGKKVTLEFDERLFDEFDRILAYVFVDGKFVNVEMLVHGYAKAKIMKPNIKYQDLFSKSEFEARDKKLGLWANVWINTKD